MGQYVALIRGINVGGAKPVAMAALRGALEAQGLGAVATVAQSGNVVFSSEIGDPESLATLVAGVISAQFGHDVEVVVLEGEAFVAVLGTNPFPEHVEEGSRLLVTFLDAPVDPSLESANDPAALDPARIIRVGAAYFQWCPDGVSNAPNLVAFISRRLGRRATARNWNTVVRIRSLLSAAT